MNAQLKQKIENSILLSDETRTHWLAKIDTLTDEQCDIVMKTLTDSDERLKNIINTAMAAPENAELAEKIKQDIDHVWRTYMQDTESLSKQSDDSDAEGLLGQL